MLHKIHGFSGTKIFGKVTRVTRPFIATTNKGPDYIQMPEALLVLNDKTYICTYIMQHTHTNVKMVASSYIEKQLYTYVHTYIYIRVRTYVCHFIS